MSAPAAAPADLTLLPFPNPIDAAGNAIVNGQHVVNGVAGNVVHAAAAPVQAAMAPALFLAKISDPHFALRVVYVVGGVAAILLGLRMLAGEGGAAGAVGDAVKSGTDHAAAAAKTARTTAKDAATAAALA